MRVAVLIPCLNEEQTIGKVISDFNAVLPESEIYVYDNGSSDQTVSVAEKAGAFVNSIEKRGKTNVVRAMFKEIDADIYIMIDGDDTYDASVAPQLLDELINNSLDMVTGARSDGGKFESNRFGHDVGNKLITKSINLLFNTKYKDCLSGYRVMTRDFVKSASLLHTGFELETALSIHASNIEAKTNDVITKYVDRSDTTQSKLNTYSDGSKIMLTILGLAFRSKPIKYLLPSSLLTILTVCGITGHIDHIFGLSAGAFIGCGYLHLEFQNKRQLLRSIMTLTSSQSLLKR